MCINCFPVKGYSRFDSYNRTKRSNKFLNFRKMKGYKVLTKDMTSPYDNKTQWELGKITKINKDEKLEIAKHGLHLCKSLNNVSIGKFGSRVFEAEIIGDFIEDDDKFCTYEVKLIKELPPEEITDSFWAYLYCNYINDDPKVRKNITNPRWAFNYCKFVKNDPKIRKNIISSQWIYYYCREIKDDPKVRKNITDSQWAFYYCKFIKDNHKVRKYITDSQWAYYYCKEIKDDPKVRKYIIK